MNVALHADAAAVFGAQGAGAPAGENFLRLERDVLGSLAATTAREWLVTNGLGGYASGTVGGAGPAPVVTCAAPVRPLSRPSEFKVWAKPLRFSVPELRTLITAAGSI